MAVSKENIWSERQREHFNRIEDNYEKAVNDPKARYYRKLVYRQFFKDTTIEKMMKSGKKIVVLEAMCGDGMGRRVLKGLYKGADLDYEGFDYSDEMVREAQKKYPDLTFKKQDVNKFESDKKYDVIILLSGLHHIPRTAGAVMKNMYHYLKDGGCFISVEPTYNIRFAGFLGDRVYKHSSLYDSESERRFCFKYLNSIFLDAGFKIENQFYPGLLAYLLWWFNPYPKILKLGSLGLVKKLYRFEHRLYENAIGKKLSLATFTILRK